MAVRLRPGFGVRTSRATHWILAGVALVGVAIAAGFVATPLLERFLRARIIDLMERHFGARLQVKRLDVRLFPRIEISGDDLIFRERDWPDGPPLISLRQFSASSNIFEMLARPPRVHELILKDLHIDVARRSKQAGGEAKAVSDFIIDTVRADGTLLTVHPKNPDKPSLDYHLKTLRLWSSGTATPMSFRSSLTNAKPPGDIQTTGQFGPWNKEDPDQTPVQGKYAFRDADLSVFRGISGKLTSNGSFRGVLERIEVDGQTDVPDFALKVSGNPVDLRTRFHAVVDGTDGDTLLQPVDAQFGSDSVTARGSVEGTKGVPGKTVRLDVTASGEIADMLRLAVKGKQPPMRGEIRFQTTLEIPPGAVDIANKLKLDGRFNIDSAHFSKFNIQEHVNGLSHAGSGRPKEPKTITVASNFGGRFHLEHGELRFPKLAFAVPGVAVVLDGRYGLLNDRLDFHGTARMRAEVSQTTTGWKAILLKVVDPFFKKKGSGAVIPIKITGTREHPHFGLDVGRKKK